MKNLFLIFIFSAFLSCGSDSQVNNCFSNLSFNETIDLGNPQFIDLQVPGTSLIFSRLGRNLIIIHRGTNPKYKVFDLECPERNCGTPMSFDGLKLKCSCHNKEYSTLGGEPIDGKGCFALLYNTLEVGNNRLQISY